MKNNIMWVAFRDGIVCESFDTREDAVRWLKELLKQALKDFDKQNKNECEYDYEIDLKSIEIRKYARRETFLGLLRRSKEDEKTRV